MQPSRRPTILLIDADPDILKLMEFAFAEERFDLITRPSPDDGLRVLRERQVDCVLIDIHFDRTPECFGFMRALRCLPRGADLPILATSATMEPKVASKALDLGARKFISKPFYPGEILREVRAVFA